MSCGLLVRSSARALLLAMMLLRAAAVRADEVLPSRASDAPAFRPIRYQEDYASLRGTERAGLDVLKFVPLGAAGYLSFGGQHRLRYEYLAPVDLGLAQAAPRESVMFVRNLLHVDLHATPWLRLFTEVGAHHALGAPAREQPPGEDAFDVHQLFLELRITVSSTELTLRAGRQEMSLGSTRWVSTRDGTNVRQAFDLVRASLRASSVRGETFAGVVPALARGVLDDAPDRDERFWGSYWTIDVLRQGILSFDVFYLGRRRAHVRYRELAGDERRHTLGLRVFGELEAGFEYIGHALVQVGQLDAHRVLAWGFAGGLWQRLPEPLAPLRFGVRWDALSGDRRAGDGRVTTFHPLFPNQTFFSALPAIYPTNLYEVHPLVQFEHEQLEASAGCVFFYRQSGEDAVYQPPGGVLYDATATRAPYTGSQLSISLAHRPSRHLLLQAEYSRVFAGTGLARAGGESVDFFAAWTTFTY